MKCLAAPFIVLLAVIAVNAGDLSDTTPGSASSIMAARVAPGSKHAGGTEDKCRRTGMVLCAGCCEKYQPELKGDGECPVHGPFSFVMDRLAVPCARCAREKGICQMCGKLLGGK